MAQEKASADALDVNAFVDVLDEYETLTHAVREVLKASNLPVFVDTQDFVAAEAVLRLYPGIGAYNSIPARREALTKWLPMIRKYGFKAVISLIGKEVPKDSRERIRNARVALSVAKKVGFSVDDLVFDPLVLPVATEQNQIKDTLETMSRLHSMGLKTILGISNVSYGLPDRSLLNAALTAGAIKNHVTFLILNPLDETVMGVVSAACVVFKNSSLTSFIGQYRKREHAPDYPMNLISAIVQGDVKTGREEAERLLGGGISVQELVESHLAKGLETVGIFYEQGKYYIPDLLKAAEVAQAVLDLIKRRTQSQPKQGKILVATVRGDIHDIGKNLAAIIFESAGYEVVDLGKDVATGTIVKAARKHRPDFVGLSALLTTTMPEMGNVVKALKNAKLDVRVIIGGPSVSMAYARKIGAFGAARNAFEGLRLVRNQDRAAQ
jgi:5-methyltetrahydrofolate--homocysteine methyltransferase